jgi:hypothetical protein
MSEALTSLLDSTGSPEAVLGMILASPALVDEARALLPSLKHVATAKAGPEGVKAVIGRRMALYPQPQRTEAEAAAWWSDYYDVLSDVALASLEAAMRAYVADPESEFMPKPGRLRELAFVTPCRSLGRYQRAARAVQVADTPPAIEGPRVDPAEVRKMLDDYLVKAAPPAETKPKRPYTGGIPDQGGLTAQMRDLIARRGHP